ncbi:hypothetical protein EIP91_004946 [Steccherinum ochraceum]|uniref:Ribonuclease P/MRP protein subunit POP5 n=1 Tax=Steccherinum ochraceum TaxID=92696 RepID=A0A4R0RE22_9APHY|nr:hypothetical protein EIP91_004946 [Steccherinum ochraceum]
MVRFKNRWLLVEFLPSTTFKTSTKSSSTHEITSKQIWSALKQNILSHFGDAGWGSVASSLTIKYYSPQTGICIIRVARDHHKVAWAGVTLLSNIEGHIFVPNVVHLSGTIRQAQLAAIEHNREVVARYRHQAGTPAAYQDSYEAYLQTSTQEIEALQD